MRILKKINNNFAVALDGGGAEIIVYGKGIGFPAMPYELNDLSKLDRTFYSVDARYLEAISLVDKDALEIAYRIMEYAVKELGSAVNLNAVFPLADHISYALQRLEQNIVLENTVALDIQYLYPGEFEVAKKALEIIRAECSMNVPEEEATSIALHIINAAYGLGSTEQHMEIGRKIKEICGIVEKTLGLTIEIDSFAYSRFVTHLRYLLMSRVRLEQKGEGEKRKFFDAIQQDCPRAFFCAQEVGRYLEKNYQVKLNEEEQLYLSLHISRFGSDQSGPRM